MDNNKRAHSLVSNAFFYSFLTVVMLIGALFKGSLTLLNLSLAAFIMMLFSLALGRLFLDNEREISKPIIVLSFILITPFAFLIYVVAFLVEIFTTAFFAAEDEGGEYYDD